MTPQPETASKWVGEAMRLADEYADCAPTGYAAPERYALRVHLTAQDALMAQLAGALFEAEAALSDIGDADREPGDDVAWCEARAAQALPVARAALTAYEESK